MTEFVIALAIGLTLCILTVLALIMGGTALILVLAMKNSTHKIEWRDLPVDEEGFMSVEQMNKKLKEENEQIERDFL